MNAYYDSINKMKLKFQNSLFGKFYYKILKKPLKFIGSIFSWTIILILIIVSVFLAYYFIASNIYSAKGAGYEPAVSLYTIVSPSMVPNINVYDVVLVNKVRDPSEIEKGDIISYNSSDFREGEVISVTHRVVDVMIDNNGNYSYITKGDNNYTRDPVPVNYSSIIGEVSLRIPRLGEVQFFLASEIGWIIVVIIPALFVIIKAVIRITRLAELGKRIPKDSFLFPIFNKPILLSYDKTLYKAQKNVIKIEIRDKKTSSKKENELTVYKKETNNINDIYEDLKNISKK